MIDWSVNEGETPDHLDGNILFSNVEFAYPTRIDIQVAISIFGHGMKLNDCVKG